MKSDQDQRKIFQFPEVRVVEASAGSGKTFALAKRYVQLLLDPALPSGQIPLRQILAITFTKRSAFEMKERILDFLKNIALDELSASKEREILGPFPQEISVRPKSFAAMDHIIRQYNFFQVQTIDSFINELLVGCAFRIHLSANFRIRKNHDEFLRQALDRLIDRTPREPGTLALFEEFLRQYLFVENRTGWFPKKDILSLTVALFAEVNNLGKEFGPHAVEAGAIDRLRRDIIVLVRELEASLPENVDGRFRRTVENLPDKMAGRFSVDKLPDSFRRAEIPMNKGGVPPAKAERLWRKLKDRIRELCESEAYSLFNGYVNLFAEVNRELEELTRKEDVLFLSQLNRKARALFDEENLTVEELYYRLAARFRHYLIDEFQDTSLLQWKNLAPMVEEALSTGGSLFYVGDKKQAIYGFRGGEVGLFDDLAERFSHFNVVREVLDHNWRSHRSIVEFNNQVFSAGNLRRFLIETERVAERAVEARLELFTDEETQEIVDVFAGASQKHRPDLAQGYVRIEYVDAKSNEELYPLVRERVLAVVADVRRRSSANALAVLCRDNAEVELVTSWLLESGILVDSERTSNIRENFLVKELVALLKFLDSPIDNLNFASFLLGEIFGRAAGLTPEELREFIFSYRQRRENERDLYLYKLFRDVYPSIWEEYFEEFFKSAGLYPLYEMTVSVCGKFNCLERFPEYQGFLMRFLQLIQDREEEVSDIASFLEYLQEAPGEDLYVNISENQAVKVLTVHKSKGLEFPAVLIPFLGMDIQVGRGVRQGQKSCVLDHASGELRLIQLRKRPAAFSAELAEIYHREYRKSFVGELNNIYVALTRSREELYVLIPERCGNSLNLARGLIAQELESGIKKSCLAPVKEVGTRLFPIPASSGRDWIAFLKDEFSQVSALQRRELIAEGEVLHFLLSFVGNLAPGGQAQRIAEGLAALPQVFPAVADAERFRKQLDEILSCESFRPFFAVGEAAVATEVEIINRFGHTRRVDRLIVGPDEVWVVDYKLSLPQATAEGRSALVEYERQVLDYMQLIEELYPGKKVRGYLLALQQKQVKEVTGVSPGLSFATS